MENKVIEIIDVDASHDEVVFFSVKVEETRFLRSPVERVFKCYIDSADNPFGWVKIDDGVGSNYLEVDYSYFRASEAVRIQAVKQELDVIAELCKL